MAQLGFERFAVVGHDRGGRVAYRLALDRPERVTRLAVLDMVPPRDLGADGPAPAGLVPLALPGPARGLPPDRRRSGLLLRWTLRSWRSGPTPSTRGRCRVPASVPGPGPPRHLRGLPAGATVDLGDDAADGDRRRIRLPAPRPVGRAPAVAPDWDPVAIWRDWASDVRGRGIPLRPFPAGRGSRGDTGRPRASFSLPSGAFLSEPSGRRFAPAC